MPQLIIAAGVAGGTAAIIAGSTAAFLVPFATTVAAGFIGQLMSPMPSGLSQGGPQDRQVSGRSTLASRRWVIGRAQIAPATVAYIEATGTDSEFLYIVLPFCQGPAAGLDDILFDDQLIGTRDGDGYVLDGRYGEKVVDGVTVQYVRIQEDLGETTKTANADLVADSGGQWTTAHRGRGIADLVLRLQRDHLDALFPSGMPQVRAIWRGVKCYDPRDAATRYTENPALIVRWFLTLAAPDGFGADAAEIDDTLVSAAANICEERVAVDTYSSPTVTVDAADDLLTFSERDVTIGHGDGVAIASTGTIPAGLAGSTTYYAIRLDGFRCRLAATYEDAMAGTAINITSAGSGDITLSHVDQARYTCNGVYEASQSPQQFLTAVLATMAGVVWYSEGKFKVRAGVWVTPTVSLDESDLAGPPQVQIRTPRAELFNVVRGTYTDPLQDYQPTDFPPMSDATYVTQDGGVEIPRDIDFQFIDNPIRAQRLAKINLLRGRNGMIVTLPCKLSAYGVGLWDTVQVTIAHFGWSAKTFRVVGWSFEFQDAWRVILTLQEEDSTVFGWSATDADAPIAPPELTLPPTAPTAPASTTIQSGTAELLAMGDGTIMSRMLVTWSPVLDANVTGYEIRWKRSGDDDYHVEAIAGGNVGAAYLSPAQDGETYDVDIRSTTRAGARSEWTSNTHTVVGKSAAPAAPTALTATASVSQILIGWSPSPEADYAYTEIFENAANDRTTSSKVGNVSGSVFSRSALAEGDVRYYWVRHVDTSGNVSDWYPLSATAGVSATALGPTIGTDAVDTINIVAAAVTDVTSAYTGATTVLSAGTWTTVQTISVTTTGEPLLIKSTAHANTNAGTTSFASHQVRLQRNGTTIYGPVAPTGYYMIDGFIAIAILDTPAAGTYTYTLDLFPSHGCGVDGRYLEALETKR